MKEIKIDVATTEICNILLNNTTIIKKIALAPIKKPTLIKKPTSIADIINKSKKIKKSKKTSIADIIENKQPEIIDIDPPSHKKLRFPKSSVYVEENTILSYYSFNNLYSSILINSIHYFECINVIEKYSLIVTISYNDNPSKYQIVSKLSDKLTMDWKMSTCDLFCVPQVYKFSNYFCAIQKTQNGVTVFCSNSNSILDFDNIVLNPRDYSVNCISVLSLEWIWKFTWNIKTNETKIGLRKSYDNPMVYGFKTNELNNVFFNIYNEFPRVYNYAKIIGQRILIP